MAERPFPAEVNTDAAEVTIGPVTRSRHTGICPICEFAYTADCTPVVATSWGRIVHPTCMAPPLGNPVHPRRRGRGPQLPLL